MAGVMPSILGSRVFAFLLFIALVWIAVDLSKIVPGLVKMPGHVATLIDPNRQNADDQTKI